MPNPIDEFFPTPRNVISKMVSQVNGNLDRANILEPSAGKGDIVDYISDTHGVKKSSIYTIEANPDLQMTLAGKGYRVIDSDFLAFDDPYHINVILMNPPFNRGVDHALKAWNTVAPGGTVVCLLNATNLTNLHTEKRKLLHSIVQDHGTMDMLGPVFKDAQRRTDVDVVMVTLNKPEKTSLGLLDDIYFENDMVEQDAKVTAQQLATGDLVEAIVTQYDAAKRLLKMKHDVAKEFEFYTQGVIGKGELIYRPQNPPSLNDELAALKAGFWEYVFKRTRLASVTTSAMQQEIKDRQSKQASMAFTAANIRAIIEVALYNASDIMTQCVVDVFDTATSYHDKNKIHHEGWKTNKSWRLNNKIIIPRGISYEHKWGSWSLVGVDTNFYRDLDKAMCFVAGKRHEDIQRDYQELSQSRYNPDVKRPKPQTIVDAIEDHTHGYWGLDWDQKFDSKFFTIKIHKKGTVHLWFKDDDLCAAFNRMAAKGKNWVGDGS